MREFINHLTERNYSNRTVGLIENGSWNPMATKVMKGMLEKSKNLTYANTEVKILSALNEESKKGIESLAEELCKEYSIGEKADKNDMSALFNIGYGLYVVTTNDGKKDNGLILNSVMQVTDCPTKVAVTVSKQNYSHHIIKQTGKLNLNCLSEDAPFSVFENFGFRSGRSVDKFENQKVMRTENGLVYLTGYTNAVISLKVEEYLDLDSHGMFICSVAGAKVLSDKKTMTYTYYQQNVKPKPQSQTSQGYICRVCGYVLEDSVLPDDFICPWCKHGASSFEEIK